MDVMRLTRQLHGMHANVTDAPQGKHESSLKVRIYSNIRINLDHILMFSSRLMNQFMNCYRTKLYDELLRLRELANQNVIKNSTKIRKFPEMNTFFSRDKVTVMPDSEQIPLE